tara:strand:- start:267 stop:866 length:600 start_codon:yes stop_codon:yes gene_type:complete
MTDITTSSKLSYVAQHYGLIPSELVTKPTGVVFWNSGLWLLSENVNKADIHAEYSAVVSSALDLCKKSLVERFYLVETLLGQGGLQGNLDGGELNVILQEEYSRRVSPPFDQCLRIAPLTWHANDWAHIQKDRVHPTILASVSLAKVLWQFLSDTTDGGVGCQPTPHESISMIDAKLSNMWCSTMQSATMERKVKWLKF